MQPVCCSLHSWCHTCCRVGRTADTLEDAAFELQSVITVVEATHQPMSRRDPLRPLMDKIYEYAERHSPFSPSMCTKARSPASLGC